MGEGAAKLRSDVGGSPEAVERGIISLFAPSPLGLAHLHAGEDENDALWRADAIHRARNMAQLSASLADVASKPSRAWLSDPATREIKALSKLFVKLAHEDLQMGCVECSTMIASVATGLASTFGQARQIICDVAVEPVSLSQEKRRALVLITSELIINTLKYAFPSGQGGRISVVFGHDENRICLTIRDNGIGHARIAAPGGGEGSSLIRRLASILGAELRRTDGLDSKGWGFQVRMPADLL